MINSSGIASKLLILESDSRKQEELKRFCQDYELKGVIVPKQEQVLTALESNLNIGAIVIPNAQFYSENLINEIHYHHHEIPLFFDSSLTDPNKWVKANSSFSDSSNVEYYDGTDLNSLKDLLSKYVFNLIYPDGMIDILKEISLDAIESRFNNITVKAGNPYLSSDKRIFGERIEMMSVRSNWCEGVMMLQSKGTGIEKLITSNHTGFDPNKMSVVECTEDLLRELMNQMWGSFKLKFVPDGFTGRPSDIEIPVTINHLKKYISFGVKEPLLCFKFVIEDANETGESIEPIPLYLKFSFHLYWNTDEYTQNTEDDMGAGGLEFF